MTCPSQSDFPNHSQQIRTISLSRRSFLPILSIAMRMGVDSEGRNVKAEGQAGNSYCLTAFLAVFYDCRLAAVSRRG
jgi:hypothetical protein